jgi:hypothetical protein
MTLRQWRQKSESSTFHANSQTMSPEQREAHDRIYGVERGALAGTGPMA